MNEDSKKRKMRPDADYDVGYGKPPVQHHFAPGNNANPRGRPRKKSRSFEEILEETVGVTLDGKRQKLTKREIILRRLVQDAASGDHRSRLIVLAQLARLAANGGENTVTSSEADEKMLKDYIEEMQKGDKPDRDTYG